MNRRSLGLSIATAAALLAAVALRAADDPHGITYGVGCSSTGGGQYCHALHGAAGGMGGLITTGGGTISTNLQLCTSCHFATGGASRFDTAKLVKANVTTNVGSSHSFDVSPVNAAAGATAPVHSAMANRLSGGATGNVVCSTCHNQHDNISPEADAGRLWIGTPTRTSGTGTGTIAMAAAGSPVAKGYTFKIVGTGAAGTATFQVSNDGGTSYFALQTTGTGVVLNGSVGVTATFTGSFVANDLYRSYVGYGFLRLPLDKGANSAVTTTDTTNFCRDCHQGWAVSHTDVRVFPAPVGKSFSHPVGVSMNANGKGYDRAAPLSAAGGAQGSNQATDLRLASDGTVQCFTCHGVHNAPSSSSQSAYTGW